MKKTIDLFLESCRENIKLEEEGVLGLKESAYNICGLCNKYFDEIIPEFSDIMDIACDLELPKEYSERDLKDWSKLKERFKNK
jgi:hypothetical protein